MKKESKTDRQKRISRELGEYSKLKGYVAEFSGDPERPSRAVDIDARLSKYRHYFPTRDEYWKLREDVKRLVYTAADEADSWRLFTERERALLSFQSDKIKAECERRKLPKGETVDRKTKHEIALAAGMKPGEFSKFKSGQKVYHRISKALADIGYHQPSNR